MVDAHLLEKARYTLYEGSDLAYLIQNGGAHKKAIKIDLKNGVYSLADSNPDTSKMRAKDINQLFGLVEFVGNKYLVLVDQATIVGTILRSSVYRVDNLYFMPMQKIEGVHKIHDKDQKFVKMFKKVVDDRCCFFSYDIDLTNNLQRNINNALQTSMEEGGVNTNKRKHDHRFFLNYSMTAEFRNEYFYDFVVPVVFGTFYIQQVFVENHKLDFGIISKKDVRRLGRRFHTRGIDDEGNTSNYVETECFVIIHDEGAYRCVSFTQTRGSIPILWTQRPCLKYTPSVKMSSNHAGSTSAAKKHFKEQTDIYGAQILVNLIDKKKDQKLIGDAFSRVVDEVNDGKLFYVWFDFHHECRKMKWENLSILVDHVAKQLHEHQYFEARFHSSFQSVSSLTTSNCAVTTQQLGVVRTNCMDCLDRTNVAQSVFSRGVLHKQLFKMGIIGKPKGTPFEHFPYELEEAFREGWTQNANIIGKLYTGTNALKTDFTRTGKRTIKGAIKDGIYSVTRFYNNNFTDGYHEDCYDLITKKLNAKTTRLQKRSAVSPLLSLTLGLLATMFIIRGLVQYALPENPDDPNADDHYWRYRLLHGFVIVGTIFGFMKAVMRTGKRLVDQPSILK